MSRLRTLGPLVATGRPLVASAPGYRRDPLAEKWRNSRRWQKLRLRIIARDLFTCQQTGKLLLGKHPAPDSPVVDHKVKPNGHEPLFWDESNLQTVSKAWHDREKQRLEKTGRA